MSLRVIADAVVVLHIAFVLFVVLGGIGVLYRPWLAWLHLPAACWGVLVATNGWICPLTPLETSLRDAAGEAGYSGGFVEHYLIGVLYPAGLTPDLQSVLGGCVIVINVVIYSAVIRKRRQGRAAEP